MFSRYRKSYEIFEDDDKFHGRKCVNRPLKVSIIASVKIAECVWVMTSFLELRRNYNRKLDELNFENVKKAIVYTSSSIELIRCLRLGHGSKALIHKQLLVSMSSVGVRVYDLLAIMINHQSMTNAASFKQGDEINGNLINRDEELQICLGFLGCTSLDVESAYSNFGRSDWTESDLSVAIEDNQIGIDKIFPRLYVLRSSPGVLIEINLRSSTSSSTSIIEDQD